MKKALFAFVLTVALTSLADPGKIELAKTTLDTANASIMSTVPREPVCLPSPAGTRLYLAQPETNFTPEEQEAIKELGLSFYGHVPPNAYILEGTEEQIDRLKELFSFVYLGEFLPEYKTVCELDNGIFGAASAENPRYVLVAVTRDEFLQTVKDVLDEEGVEYRVISETICPALTAHLTGSQIARLAKMGEVAAIESYVDPVAMNDMSRSSHCCNVDELTMRGYNGSSQTVCLHDSGLDNGDTANIHPDFKNKRVSGKVTSGASRERGSSTDWYDNSGHGTHVAGSMCGTGAASDGQFKGMAPGASIYVLAAGADAGLYTGSDSELEDTYNQGCRVMNNSWGSASNGSYSSTARSFDTLIWNHKDYTVCFAAGNDNNKLNLPTECKLTPGACAKNVIAVGASENYRPLFSDDTEPYDGLHQGMAFFSSRGPCSDGRIKPDIVAPGTGINSCSASREHTSVRSEYYAYLGGTSMACPMASGCAAVIRDYLVKKRGVSSASASLVKAIMFCGARTLYPGQYPRFEEVPSTRPNSVEGHGHINLKESLEPTDGELRFKEYSLSATGQVITNFLEKPENTDLSVALVWSDYPGTTSAARALVNNLDLILIDPNGTKHTLNDSVNNAEVLRLGNSPAGRYTVIIKGTNIMSGPQPCSLAVNYGRGLRAGEIGLAAEPSFPWGKDYCDIVLTNLAPNSYITYKVELAEDNEKCFSLEGATGTFLSTAKVRLRFLGGAGLSDYPSCVFRVNCGGSGALSRRIGFPNGSEKKGYVLYRADFSSYPYPSPVGYDSSVTSASDTMTDMDNEPVEFFDQVYEENFESYATGDILGQGGWSRSYGHSTNGTARVVSESGNKYLSIRRQYGQYAVDVAVPGIETGWGEGHTNRFFRISCRIRLAGNSSKSLSLISPDICKTTFERMGGGFILSTGYGDASHPSFNSRGYPTDNVWFPLDMLIEADPVRLGGGDRHVLRHLSFGGQDESCAGVYAENVNADFFSAMRFFLEGVGSCDIDDLKVERCVSENIIKQFLKVTGNGSSGLSEDERGLFVHVGIPANLHRKYDLVMRGEMAMAPGSSKAVITQNASRRQFQSEIYDKGGEAAVDLTDYLTNPGLVTQTFPKDSFFTYGFRMNTAPVNKVLKTVFAGPERYIVNDKITYEGASTSSAVDDFRIYLPDAGSTLKLASLEVRLSPLETPKLGVSCVPFSIGDEEVEWALTNSLPDEAISFTARITKNPDWFEVTPASGTFTDSATIRITALKTSDEPNYIPGEIEIDGGASGVFNLRFGMPTGSEESGYVLYEGNFDDLVSGDIKAMDVNWSGEEALSANIRVENGANVLHLRKESNSALPEGSQGAFCYIGMPGGLGPYLDLRVQAKLRFPSAFEGGFYFTQNEDQRIFQSTFNSNGSGASKTVKLVLTDYARNTGLFSQRAPIGYWLNYDYTLNVMPDVKILREIFFFETEKTPEQKVTGQNVQPVDAVDYLRLNLAALGSEADLRELRVSLEAPVPEPLMGLFALCGLIVFGLRKRL